MFRMPFKRKYTGTSSRQVKRSKTRSGGGRNRFRYGARGTGKIARICRKTIFRMAESKSKAYSHGKTEVYHNVYANTTNPLNTPFGMPTQGGKDDERSGDRIYVSGFKVRMLLGQKFDRPNVTWKIWVVRQGIQTSSVSNSWRNVTGNVLLDPSNLDQVKVLYTKTIKFGRSTMFKTEPTTAPIPGLPQYTPNEQSLEQTKPISFWIPYRREYKFADNNGTQHNDNPIHICIAAYDAYGTLTSDNIGYVQVFSEMFYRDP